MRTLLDTNIFLWFVTDSDRLSATARNHIADLNNSLCLSIASFWEIAIKTSIGKLELLQPFDRLIPKQIKSNSIKVLPINLDHLSQLIKLPFHHRDPFDRLIISQSITEKIPIVFSDSAFKDYELDIIW